MFRRVVFFTIAVFFPFVLFADEKKQLYEVDLGNFETVIESGKTIYQLKVHLFGLSSEKNIDEVLAKNKARLRSGILLELRSSTLEQLIDPSFASVSEKLRVRVNGFLGNQIEEVIYADFSLEKIETKTTPEFISSPRLQNPITQESDEVIVIAPAPPARVETTQPPKTNQLTQPYTMPTTRPNVKIQDAETTKTMMVHASRAIKGIQDRVKNDPILKQLLDSSPTAENLFFPEGEPDYIEWFAHTGDEWNDIPTRSPPYRQSGKGYIAIRFFADFKYDAPRTPYKPPRGCYVTDEVRKIPGGESRVIVLTRLSDPRAGARLMKIVEEEFTRAGVRPVKI